MKKYLSIALLVTKYTQLLASSSFTEPTLFTIDLSAEEQNVLNSIKIKPKSIRETHRFDISNNEKNFESVLQDLDNDEDVKEKLPSILSKIWQQILHQKETVIPHLIMSSTTGLIQVENSQYHDKFGWHLDTSLDLCNRSDQSSSAFKLSHRCIVPLIGPGTIYTDVKPDKTFLEFFCQDHLAQNPDIVKRIDDMIPEENRFALGLYQGILYDTSQLIHTRPNTDKSRMLLIANFYRTKELNKLPESNKNSSLQAKEAFNFEENTEDKETKII